MEEERRARLPWAPARRTTARCCNPPTPSCLNVQAPQGPGAIYTVPKGGPAWHNRRVPE